MAGPSDINIFSWLFDHVENVLNSYVTGTSQHVITTIAPVATTLFGIFVVLWGLAALRNQIEEPVTDGTMRLIKVAIVLGIALNVTYYGQFVVDFAMNTPMHFISAATGHPLNNYQSAVGQVLDDALSKAFQVGQRSWDQGGITSPGPVIVAIVIWVSMVLVLLFSAALVLLSLVAMDLLLAIGPVFVMLLLFRGTQRFFELWMGQIINYMVTMILAVMATLLLITVIDDFLTQAIAQGDASMGTVLIQTLALGGVGVLILRQVPSIASAIAGGIAMSTLGAYGATMRGLGGAGAGTTKFAGRAAWNSRAGQAARRGVGNATAAARRGMANAFRRKNSISPV